MKRAWDYAELAFVWLFIGIGFFVLAAIWKVAAHAAGSTKDFWDVTTAIGTCGAVVVALWSSTIDRRSRARERAVVAEERKIAAQLTAAGAAPRLSTARSKTQSATIGIDSILSEISREGITTKIIQEIDFKINEIQPILDGISFCTFEEIRSMSALPNNCAMQIEAAQGRITGIKANLAEIRLHYIAIKNGIKEIKISEDNVDFFTNNQDDVADLVQLNNDQIDALVSIAGLTIELTLKDVFDQLEESDILFESAHTTCANHCKTIDSMLFNARIAKL
ncbi:hypothetical protein [Burkholderia gladioli]|uniref:hypothetical protein n=1 Tax=Burkholderia gladioli TaxID=28095 RepID=UPI0012D92055|nr:hypothetical protein [Burkholderia gladioli]